MSLPELLGAGALAIAASFVVAELVARAVLRIGGRYFVWTPYSRVATWIRTTCLSPAGVVAAC